MKGQNIFHFDQNAKCIKISIKKNTILERKKLIWDGSIDMHTTIMTLAEFYKYMYVLKKKTARKWVDRTILWKPESFTNSLITTNLLPGGHLFSWLLTQVWLLDKKWWSMKEILDKDEGPNDLSRSSSMDQLIGY